MPFHKTYEEFLNEMEAVKNTREVIPDDFFLAIILPLAYQHTMWKIADRFPEEVRAQVFWNDLCNTRYFDPHFSWTRAEGGLKEMYPEFGANMGGLFADLRNACIRNTFKDYPARVMHIFGRLFPKYYA